MYYTYTAAAVVLSGVKGNLHSWLTVEADSNPVGVDRPSVAVKVFFLPVMIPCDV